MRPIFEPELAGEAVVWAARRAPRQLMVGASTVATRYANVVAPGLVDRRLARRSYDDQQTDQPVDHAAWADNLFDARDDACDAGPRGVFGDQARERSIQLWASIHKPAVLAGVAAVPALAAAATFAARRS